MKNLLTTLLLSMFASAAVAQTTATDTVQRVVELEEITITSQQREQQLMDIPASIIVVGGRTLESVGVRDMEQLAGFVPGLNILVQNPNRPNLVIRGLTSDEVSPTAQPRVSVYFDQAPISRASMAVTELYDMERIEVMKGPQGTLFGRGSQAGAISFITKKPGNRFGGYVSAGAGNYCMMHFEGALNVPVTAGLSARIAGVYSYRDGYVKNTAGGTLNDKNTAGGRFSLAFAPKNSNFKADLTVNYQRDDNSGAAFMSKTYPNANGERDIFKYEATLDKGKALYNKRDVFGTILNARYYTSEQNYFSSITSYFRNSADSRFDGDGCVAPAIDMSEFVKANQFTQELRYNFSFGNRFSGVAGASFWREDVSQKYRFTPDEQYMVYLLLQIPEYMVQPNGQTFPMPSLPPHLELGPLAGMPLPNNHEEESVTEAINSAYDLFFDATYELLPKLNFTAGVRATFENFSVTNRAYQIGAIPSTLGMFTGAYPNFFFAPRDNPNTEKSFSTLTWRANLKYDIDRRSNVYAGYSKGHRPHVLQYNSAGTLELINAETLHSFDAGYRFLNHRFMFDVSLYYQLYQNFQTSTWRDNNYLVDDAGKATSYGAEIAAKAVLNNYLNIFGNYAYAHATFDDKDSKGNPQSYAGHEFRLTPRHSFLLGFNAGVDATRNLRITLTPTYSWKSHIWFEDANDAGIEQDAYGLLSANLSLLFKKQGLTVAFVGSNLTGEKYLIGAGNMGAMFGIPTFVPGAPRMIGGKVTWKF